MDKIDFAILIILSALASFLLIDGGCMLVFYIRYREAWILIECLKYLAVGIFSIIFVTKTLMGEIRNEQQRSIKSN